MDTLTPVVAIALVLALCVTYFFVYIRRGKAHGHTWFTRWKPRGHPDIGPDEGRTVTPTLVAESRPLT